MTIDILKSELLVNIDAKREEMIGIAISGDYKDKKTIMCSQELDQLLYKYQQILFEEKRNTNISFLELMKVIKKVS
ncbi:MULTISPECIES: aspartyl-phosphate phosphatase Spo0E family protein [Peribacillus]|uniref:aspartyl-phosphate phosphatase Spo0E family protein n=1 Tax=Peribacillus TaxID=2675229 RepID=UPI0027892425|nr:MULTISPECIES: aspartyl-phosphate phosphatase Spo0E family protein [Peribacillus]MDQ0884569.1 stage 0 sporulation regulatory protein [Peribacillus sp. V2I11]MED3994544.1 aspartyl-phosphate phosphatase Spo0E family protein [Peribacillus frigoritolerans]